MNFWQKVQNLPITTKKTILWLVVIIIGISLMGWFAKNASQKLKGLEEEEFLKELNLPIFKEKLEKIPKIEMSKLEISENENYRE